MAAKKTTAKKTVAKKAKPVSATGAMIDRQRPSAARAARAIAVEASNKVKAEDKARTARVRGGKESATRQMTEDRYTGWGTKDNSVMVKVVKPNNTGDVRPSKSYRVVSEKGARPADVRAAREWARLEKKKENQARSRTTRGKK
jgi:hypothetical protein